jgi:plastocyanin
MRLAISSGVLMIGLLSSCAGQSVDNVAPQVGATRIVLKGSKFSPRVTQVPAGTQITWVWDDGSTRHDVAGDGFKSEVKRVGMFEHVFPSSGTFDYLCRMHDNMTGRVIVTDGP